MHKTTQSGCYQICSKTNPEFSVISVFCSLRASPSVGGWGWEGGDPISTQAFMILQAEIGNTAHCALTL